MEEDPLYDHTSIDIDDLYKKMKNSTNVYLMRKGLWSLSMLNYEKFVWDDLLRINSCQKVCIYFMFS